MTLDAEGGVDGTTSELLAGFRPHRRLYGVPAGRQSQAQVETLRIDGFDFPRPCVSTGFPVAAGKSCHARQRHAKHFRFTEQNGIALELSDGDDAPQAAGMVKKS